MGGWPSFDHAHVESLKKILDEILTWQGGFIFFVFNSVLVNCGTVVFWGVNHLFVFNSILVNCGIVAFLVGERGRSSFYTQA